LFEPDQHVTEIVQRLDGLPLAVELAAARVKVLSTTQILGRLGRSLDLLTTGPHDAPERQRTLRATIEWSHELLSEEERQLFECLAVFPGSFAIEAAEAICSAELDALESLLDKSLLRQTGEGRFFMLETIREFALERLEEDGAEEVRRRHASYFYELVKEAAPGRVLGDAEWLDRLEAEHDNIRATLARTLHEGEAAQLLQLLIRLWRFWSVHGHWQEGRTRLESGLSTTADLRTPERAQILEGAADLAWKQGRYDEGRAYLDESLELWRELGDRRGATGSLHFRGNLESAAGHNVEARALWEEAQQAWRELGDAERFAATVYNLGLAALAESDDDRAVSQFEESLALARREGLGVLEALSTQSLGFALLNTHRRAEAVALLREALLAHRRLGDREAIAICLIAMAEASELDGEAIRAARLLAAADALTQEIGFAFQAELRRRHESLKSKLVSMVTSEEFDAAYAEGAGLGQDRAVEYALAEID
jgi:tetratricopeptide (TPR) repeat protein